MSVTSGWGRLTWNQANWNEATTLKTGWGAQAWGDGEWGELKDAISVSNWFINYISIGSVDVPDVGFLNRSRNLHLHKVKLLFLLL